MFEIKTFLILSLIAYVTAIRVPVDSEEDSRITEEKEVQRTEVEAPNDDKPIVYAADGDNVDSYLIPPDPHASDEEYATSDGELRPPATFLQPPLPNASVDYLAPQPLPIQTDWYPIVQGPIKPLKYRPKAKVLPLVNIPILPLSSAAAELPPRQESDSEPEDPVLINLPLPSSELQPPKDEPADYVAVSAPSSDLQLPLMESKRDFQIPAVELQLPLVKPPPSFDSRLVKELPLKFNFNPAQPTLALHLTPPKPPVLYKYKNPTKLYPKKYVSAFKPVPIPLMAYDYKIRDVPKVKVVKTFDEITNSDMVAPDDKTVYEYEKVDQKRKLKNEEDSIKQEEIVDTGAEKFTSASENEPETSETGYRYTGRNRYPGPVGPPRPVPLRVVSQPLRVAPHPAANAEKPAEREPIAPPPGDRTEFRMHGMNGPHSYQFGYDTGKGKNRQFRYEERDNDGRVHGHYGYMDKLGKLRVVKYEADPERGFHSDAVPDPDDTKPDGVQP